MKKIIIEYLESLNYKIKEENDSSILFIHNKTKKNLLIVFQYFNTGKAPLFDKEFPGKKITVLSRSDMEMIGIEYFEEHESEMGKDNTVIIYDDNYMEHIMKDIWFFLNS